MVRDHRINDLWEIKEQQETSNKRDNQWSLFFDIPSVNFRNRTAFLSTCDPAATSCMNLSWLPTFPCKCSSLSYQRTAMLDDAVIVSIWSMVRVHRINNQWEIEEQQSLFFDITHTLPVENPEVIFQGQTKSRKIDHLPVENPEGSRTRRGTEKSHVAGDRVLHTPRWKLVKKLRLC